MESSLTMVMHSVIISLVLYVVLAYGLKQPEPVALNRSVIVGCVACVYMILFGHGLPTKMNPKV